MANFTCTSAEAAEILWNAGFHIGYDKLAQGMRQDAQRPAGREKIFPFGDAFTMQSGKWAYIVYTSELYKFIKSHGGEVVDFPKEEAGEISQQKAY